MSTLDNLKKSAKRWLKALGANDPQALERLQRAYPNAPRQPSLRDIQHALAREQGAESWTALKANLTLRAAEWGLDMGAELAASERSLSPSDFGFHNALRRPDDFMAQFGSFSAASPGSLMESHLASDGLGGVSGFLSRRDRPLSPRSTSSLVILLIG